MNLICINGGPWLAVNHDGLPDNGPVKNEIVTVIDQMPIGNRKYFRLNGYEFSAQTGHPAWYGSNHFRIPTFGEQVEEDLKSVELEPCETQVH